MRTSIDKAGRIVIPAAIRERAGLVAGAAVEVTLEDRTVRVERIARGPRLVRIGRRLVARPTAASAGRLNLDVAVLVDEERNRWP